MPRLAHRGPSPLASQLHVFGIVRLLRRLRPPEPGRFTYSEGNDRRRDRSLIDVEICIRKSARCSVAAPIKIQGGPLYSDSCVAGSRRYSSSCCTCKTSAEKGALADIALSRLFSPFSFFPFSFSLLAPLSHFATAMRRDKVAIAKRVPLSSENLVRDLGKCRTCVRMTNAIDGIDVPRGSNNVVYLSTIRKPRLHPSNVPKDRVNPDLRSRYLRAEARNRR